MLERILLERLQRIFELKRVTMERPSESQEQECAFVEIKDAKIRIRDGRESGQVSGKIRVFAQAEKLPLGFLAKKIELADNEDTEGFFFHEIEENLGTYRNIVERSAAFVFLYDSQYDPALGTLNAVNLYYPETP